MNSFVCFRITVLVGNFLFLHAIVQDFLCKTPGFRNFKQSVEVNLDEIENLIREASHFDSYCNVVDRLESIVNVREIGCMADFFGNHSLDATLQYSENHMIEWGL